MTVRRGGSAGFGPYTVLDLYALPDGGKGLELEHGWFTEVAGGARHSYVGRSLAEQIRTAAEGADVVVCHGGGWEISTAAGIRKPDVLVLSEPLLRAVVVDGTPTLIPGNGLQLVVEVVSPGSRSERTDRVYKVGEYARSGIPQYWIVDHRPKIRMHRGILDGGTYRWEPPVGEGDEFAAEIEADRAIPVSFDPAVLVAL
ncbi:Uma2 family endonuclease [Nocardia sp. NPDC019395]|uniref:Uma2 family endonuclease n=1 Tax=Nocardia sp. NPDC019395 TaxID=3154686 RepID=UPI00340569B4